MEHLTEQEKKWIVQLLQISIEEGYWSQFAILTAESIIKKLDTEPLSEVTEF